MLYFVIDEWDALFREAKDDLELQKEYVMFLRGLFKNGNFTRKAVAGAYMTDILPIKKYGTQSAISDFDEYTMTDSGSFAGYIGFTYDEVEDICNKYDLDINEVKKWYDGYHFDEYSVYNPNSLMNAVKMGRITNYWGKTESYESIVPYIKMDYDGLKQDIVSLLGGGRVRLDVMTYQNEKEAYVPNEEVNFF